MRIIYIADDGTQFDDRFDCEDYEWKLNHPHLQDIHILDKDGNKLEDIFSNNTYNRSAKIIVVSAEAVKDLKDLADYTGYCNYEDINKVGEWEFDNYTKKFVMVIKEQF
jgi:hypothetical protein